MVFPPLSLLFCLEVHSSSVSHTPVPYYFPRCHPLPPPRTPHVTPPTPVGPSTPPAARKQVSHRRFRLWSAPNPASAPRCSPLFVAPPQYTLNPRSAVGCDPRCPPVPGFPAVSFSEPCAFGLLFSAFPRLGKLDFPLMHHSFPQPACVASAPRAFRISAASIPHAPNKPGQGFGQDWLMVGKGRYALALLDFPHGTNLGEWRDASPNCMVEDSSYRILQCCLTSSTDAEGVVIKQHLSIASNTDLTA
ncbi:hypothetical protein PGTUg99_037597 [Puccinia graminis f. sp. tritici]|uniref:Uncharacterized protein n=1 Tax=Puccinia graminis f. sp. tritici TaxID=56615 RepID=A0A5B0SN40_PUCGR|nr:hypothetical protein PGTUg99_037597 [Puccinia graminis f. sp. tritici]